MPQTNGRLEELYTPDLFAEWPLAAITLFAARCAQRVAPLWSAQAPNMRAQLERAIEIAEGVAAGTLSPDDARRPDGVSVGDWSAKRPDYLAERTASGAAIYALACACCENAEEAAVAAVLATMETHFAAAGDAANVSAAKAMVDELLKTGGNEEFQIIAAAVRDDVVRVQLAREDPGSLQHLDRVAVAAIFGPLWRAESPNGWPNE